MTNKSVEFEISEDLTSTSTEGEKIDIDFLSNDDAFLHVEEESKEADETSTVDDVNSFESEEEKKFTYEDFLDFAELFLMVLDIVLLMVLKIFAKDKNGKDEDYSLTDKQKKKLIPILAKVLQKHYVKFSIELTFIIMLLVFYIKPVKNAINRRKKVAPLKGYNDAKKKKAEDVSDILKSSSIKIEEYETGKSKKAAIVSTKKGKEIFVEDINENKKEKEPVKKREKVSKSTQRKPKEPKKDKEENVENLDNDIETVQVEVIDEAVEIFENKSEEEIKPYKPRIKRKKAV